MKWISIKTLSLAGICLLLFNACNKSNDPVVVIGQYKNIPLSESQKKFFAQSNDFAFSFFQEVNKMPIDRKNIMVSPLSVNIALHMTRNGAANETLKAMLKTLKTEGVTEEEINKNYKFAIETFTNLDPLVNLKFSNSIWHRNSLTPEKDFIDINTLYFKSRINALDFSSPKALATINEWVSNSTNGKIPSILGEITSDAMLYIINAVYFNGIWKNKFDPTKTQEMSFAINSTSKVMANSMLQEINTQYFTNDLFSAVELPYGQANYNMYVLLPNKDKNPSDIISQLTAQNWGVWLSKFFPTPVQIHLPKFKFSYDETRMIPLLSEMGMGIAFSKSADFTRINKKGGLALTEVKHKTCIEVNEKGAEAAAATSVKGGVTSNGFDPRPVIFTADHPFVFLIQEKETKAVLFMGVINNPNL